MSSKATAVVVCGLIALGSVSCAGSESTTAGPVVVFAAASLKEPFEALAEQFESEHPGVTVRLNFAGSSDLATQIVSGAPADVFASANEATMETVQAEDLLATEPLPIATNTLVIAVPPGNPWDIQTLTDLADTDRSVVLCAPQVPCGAASTKVQEVAGIRIRPVSEEGSVTDVLGKVSSGQADAGLVYTTDIAAAPEAVDGVEFDESASAVNSYPIASLTEERPAGDFIALVTGPDGQRVLAEAGFGRPAP